MKKVRRFLRLRSRSDRCYKNANLQPCRHLRLGGGEFARELIVLRLEDGVLLREGGAFAFEIVEIMAAEGSALGRFAQSVAGLVQGFLAEGQAALGDGGFVL